MSRVASLLRRRVPVYIWLPIALACAVAGSIASTLRPIPPIPNPPHVPRAEESSQSPLTASPAEEAPRTAESLLSRVFGPLREPAVIALPTEDLDLPSPSVVERQEQVPTGIAPRTPVPKVHAKVATTDWRPRLIVRSEGSNGLAKFPQSPRLVSRTFPLLVRCFHYCSEHAGVCFDRVIATSTNPRIAEVQSTAPLTDCSAGAGRNFTTVMVVVLLWSGSCRKPPDYHDRS
jgi:hypothetical protein